MEMNKELSAILFPGQTLRVSMQYMSFSGQLILKGVLTFDQSQRLTDTDQAPDFPPESAQA